MNVLLLTRYGRLGASSRLRSLQYTPWFESVGMTCTIRPLLPDRALEARYRAGGYRPIEVLSAYGNRALQLMRRHGFDLIWIEKEALPWLPAWVERLLLRGMPYVLDYDDAIFHHYDLHRSRWIRRLLGRRIDRLMMGASLVVAGNDYLAERARDAGATRVEVVPTVVDLNRYELRQAARKAKTAPRIVWIGSPSTVRYLAALSVPLSALARRTAFSLRIIGGKLHIPGVQTECVPWTEATEADALAECDIGIMPLSDSPWERGKCGYKLIQYMACALPVVASPVGANRQIVRDGENGFLADVESSWADRLAQLLSDDALRQAMGEAGRRRVETEYCLQRTAPFLGELLLKTGQAQQA
ncbi:Spore coat protein SA [Variovorax sp. PBS-H4]|uniref:glycosyltransferase family 4 protein n=1 Tax=Variovorax sp. PBS-H4 TaxID=434008 RepID=UPI001318ECF9|nr:glycosyltransferase family 4 protein [Variovorax sp. PBS-H4]VTU40968.1 Spore coat protein SA [Variovorax sp. PBS-H4]